MVFWLCAVCGALGLAEWLRRFVIQEVIYLASGYIMPIFEIVIRKFKNYMFTDEERLDKFLGRPHGFETL